MQLNFVFPRNNEEEFIKVAEKLGCKKLCFVYDLNKYKDVKRRKFNTKLRLEYGILTDEKNIKKAKKLSNYVLVKASDNNRHIIEKNRNIILFGLETDQKRDFIHQRRSGLNHILCNLANKNNIKIGFSFGLLLNSDELSRAKMIGRAIQNIRLCKKYKVDIIISSFSSNPFDLRNVKDLISLFAV
ncbi:MAG: hypothetical protein KAU20_04070 [Nanoarchaeota archaeon]|nr:hypothetical protein [Nanoarchaeota archaeon]